MCVVVSFVQKNIFQYHHPSAVAVSHANEAIRTQTRRARLNSFNMMSHGGDNLIPMPTYYQQQHQQQQQLSAAPAIHMASSNGQSPAFVNHNLTSQSLNNYCPYPSQQQQFYAFDSFYPSNNVSNNHHHQTVAVVNAAANLSATETSMNANSLFAVLNEDMIVNNNNNHNSSPNKSNTTNT